MVAVMITAWASYGGSSRSQRVFAVNWALYMQIFTKQPSFCFSFYVY